MGNWMGARKGVWQLAIALTEQSADVVPVSVKSPEELRCTPGCGLCGQTLKVLAQVHPVPSGGKAASPIGFIHRHRPKSPGLPEKEALFLQSQLHQG